jgi:hypothetical protein
MEKHKAASVLEGIREWARRELGENEKQFSKLYRVKPGGNMMTNRPTVQERHAIETGGFGSDHHEFNFYLTVQSAEQGKIVSRNTQRARDLKIIKSNFYIYQVKPADPVKLLVREWDAEKDFAIKTIFAAEESMATRLEMAKLMVQKIREYQNRGA